MVRLDRPAERIISLAPSLTELLFAAGAGSKMVGVVDYSDYPPQAKTLPIIGRHDLLGYGEDSATSSPTWSWPGRAETPEPRSIDCGNWE